MQLSRKDKELAPAIHYGSTVLRTLMANDMPGIDLLVREAVQNSLDAYPRESEDPLVNIDFEYAPFDLKKLNGILDPKAVKRLIDVNASDEPVISLVLRDRGTVGLTGPGRFKEVGDGDFGNFLKLVFSIGLRQEEAGAGGSWGYGKTVFFRVSHAPVMFYSRFNEDGKWKERLIFSLIENEKDKSNSILENHTGFAWWGEILDNGRVGPCNEEKKVRAILGNLGIEPFADEESGTLIFIPKIRSGQIPCRDQGDGLAPYWVSGENGESLGLMKAYTNVSLQRWYAPRLRNDEYPFFPKLNVFINGDEVGGDRLPLLPLFEIVRDLYRVGSGEEPLSGHLEKDDFQSFEIRMLRTFEGSASPGDLIVLRLPANHTAFGMGPPDNQKPPDVQAFNFGKSVEGDWKPIVMMTRQPGMIVSYKNSGEWVDRIDPDPDGNIVIALFVLASNARMTSLYPQEKLEEYIRENEPPAHDEWKEGQGNDGESLNLIKRLQKGIANKINNDVYPQDDNQGSGRRYRLAAAVGSRLLPRGFGTSAISGPDRKVSPGGGGGGGSSQSVSITTEAILFEGNKLRIPFTLNAASKTEVELSISAAAERGEIKPSIWESEIGGDTFPFYFSEIVIEQTREKSGKWSSKDVSGVKLESPDKWSRLLHLSAPGMSVKGILVVEALGAGYELVVHAG